MIVLGAGAAFVVLGIAGVTLRSQCSGDNAGLGLCASAPEQTAIAPDQTATEPQLQTASIATPAAPAKPKAASVIDSSFDVLVKSGTPSAASLVSKESAPMTAIAQPKPQVLATTADEMQEPLELSRRVVKSVAVSADGQPIWPTATATKENTEALAAIDSVEPADEVEQPLAYAAPINVTANGAPIPADLPVHAKRDAPATVVADVEPKAKADMRTVKGGGVNVRSGPSRKRGKIFTLSAGEDVKVTDEDGGWLKVTDDRGRTGWVYKSYLR